MARGEDNAPWVLQSDVVHRDETTTAWINARWWADKPGAIVIPNEHVENMYALERGLAGDVHETARRLALAMKEAFRCDGVSTRQHNEPGGEQEVWHYHLHVFPRFAGVDLYRSTARLTTPEEREPHVRALREALARLP